ncbi:MAG: DUF3853 family protein [Bacteroidetes bacterium]|nr:DUF3853 family protein [Bacteroidota bacterium]
MLANPPVFCSMNIIMLTKDELRQLIREVIQETIIPKEITLPRQEEVYLTSIKELAKFFKCSLPTAQKIKNSIPKDLYAQYGKRFSIPLSLLLEYGKRNA